MGRVKRVFKPSDYPGSPDEPTSKALSKLFEHLYPGQPNSALPAKSSAVATVARDPHLALLMVKISDYMMRDMSWTTEHRDLHQLVGQVLDLHFKCDFSFQAHMPRARASGIGPEQQALLPFWRTVKAFSEEQRLVIEYTLAVAAGDVPGELFTRVVNQYGEMAAIEVTVAVAWWSVWTMITNATRPEVDFGYGKPSG
jgi:hypothetical protein